MKKLLCLLLALVMTLSISGVVALAEGEEAIVIDGVRDELYTKYANRILDAQWWGFWADQSNTTEPVDPERAVPTLWFTWDDSFVYLYFEVVSKDALYQPSADEVRPPDRQTKYYEQINIYVDTSPSFDYYAPCQHPTEDNPNCNHFYCNANDGDGKYYRLMARTDPAWNNWHNYYRSDEGVFLTYEEFCAKRGGESGYEDLEAMYKKENGDGAAVSFANFETNTYGFEMKYPRNPDEEYFKINLTFDINETVWEEFGPELPYTMAICQPAWMNHEGMAQIWYADYPELDVADDPQILAIRRMMEQLPPNVSDIAIEHRVQVIELNAAYEKLSDDLKTELEETEVAFITGAFERIGKLDYLANLGDVNVDGKKDAKDALVVLRAAVGKTELDDAGVARAEVTGDGAVSAKDALEILQFSVGKRTEFTVARTVEL